MEIESAGDKVEVVVVEHDTAERVRERVRLNAGRVELGLRGNDKSPTAGVSGVCGRLSGPSGMEEIGCWIESRTEKSSSVSEYTSKSERDNGVEIRMFDLKKDC